MAVQIPPSETNYLYSGGLAETVSQPSTLTYSFLAHWFCGSGSVGKAMHMLGLPYEIKDTPLVVLYDGELCVNLLAEEETLYRKTVFSYVRQSNFHDLPKLTIRYSRLFSPQCIKNTIKLILYQSELISSPNKAVDKAKGFISKMPSPEARFTVSEIDQKLKDEVWPYVIAVGALSEFYSRLIEQEIKDRSTLHDCLVYIGHKVKTNDWFFTSISHQARVREGKMSFDEYLEHYGIRAGKDYELTCPRWYEEKEKLYKHIMADTVVPDNQQEIPTISVNERTMHYITAVISLQVLRSEARRIALEWFDLLRKKIIAQVGTDFSYFTRDDILGGITEKIRHEVTTEKKAPSSDTSIKAGQGMPVSKGIIAGTAHHVSTSFDVIPPGTIGIFPNASTDFTMLYPKCAGMIFLVGGQTSHGAIVAREFGTPAIIEGSVKNIPEGSVISLDGENGTWKLG